ncbi:DUF6169 family protein [Dyadobacter sp. MSC1_007]|jgi:hypothetical protein|uniref:DUF6169 family protein n=1 Tax=Dyadobacter sp. MSC1_007 TaxID=2909264 RepID=UPI00202FBC26|nr:DUF6169 family protein [Dyadobacter sp. MSC1_007]
MQVESNSSTPYSFFYNPDTGTYHFDTKYNIDFTVYFALDSSWFPSNPQFSQEVYTFGFWTSAGSKRDSRVMTTIAATVVEHFSKNKNSILTFICDDDDQKQINRMRKFNGWYLLRARPDIIKLDKDVVFESKTKHTSLVMHIENLHFEVVREIYLSADADVTWKILD